ncbi:demethylspheroidene O-methyltransferase [Rubricella aquisinus]|uniref:Demethylspheroidene O-methyltransferase n=1 Tax=Rubricella aquisinus TaxID=2028108 RepID=A0A840WK86_9RHOB|nr:demethylspheroidene O-methyltransferase [Rubricella aquisinus]
MVALPQDRGTPPRQGGWFYRWRTAKIADPAFQEWAARFPLTRPFVRKQAEALYDLVAGFVYSQVLHAFVELDIPRRLMTRPRSADALAPEIGLTPEATRRLLQAAVAIGLCRVRHGKYRLSQMGAALIGAPGVIEMIRHHPQFYQDVADPVALLRGEVDTNLSKYWGYVGGAQTHDMQEDIAAPYSALMAVSQAMVAAETRAAYPMDRHKVLLDIGGGEGAFVSAMLAYAPDLRGIVFDLPAVAERATARLEREGLSRRAEATGGSFLTDPIPQGADLISLIRVCYDHQDDVVRALLRKIRKALPPGGRLLISEPMSGGDRPTRPGDAYFGFYTAAMSTGRPRSLAEHAANLEEAGFSDVKAHPTAQPFITQVISARAD